MKNYLKVISIIFLLFFFLEDTLIVFNKVSDNHPILGQKLNGMAVSRLSKEQLYALIKNTFDTDTPLKLTFNRKIVEVRKREIGARINYEATIAQLNNKGRDGNLIQNIIDQNKALFGLSDNKLIVQVSKPLLMVKVLAVADEFNRQPTPQMPDFSGNWQNTLSQTDGTKVQTPQLSEKIVQNIFSPPIGQVTIPTQKLVKNYPSYDLNKIRRLAAEYSSEPLSITSGGLTFTLTPNDLKSLLRVSELPDPTNPKKTIMMLTLDHTILNHKLRIFAEKVETVTNAEFNYHDAHAAIFGQFYTGTRRVLDAPTGGVRGSTVLGTTTNSLEKVVYFTFDDGPNIIYHPMLLDILKEKGVEATFYFVGSNSKLYASTTKRTIKEGHVIANHSLTHAYLAKLLPSQIYDEIKTTQDVLNSFLTPNKITLFRPPYGGTSPLVEKDAISLGLKQMLWTVDPKDWSDPSTEELVKRVVSGVQNGSVVLMHSNHFSTVKALPTIIDKLRAKGYQFKIQE